MKTALIILSIVLLFGCNSQQQIDIPKGILSKEKMTALLIDLHLTEATINLQQAKGKNIFLYTKQQYEILYKKYNITQKQFEKNILFYANHIQLLDEAYTVAIDSLSKKQSEPIK